jgi:type IV pilus assembly protein PilY1
MKMNRHFLVGAALFCLAALSLTANAQTTNVVQDTFTGTSANLNWASFNGACLTAGNGTGTIPACNTLSYYSGQTQTGLTGNADTVGNGALRLTNGCVNGTCYYDQNGAIISTTPFSSGEGIQVTFTTYTYGGDNSGGHGADGIGFYLLNGADATEVAAAAANPTNSGSTNTWTLGSWGGSLGYSCSNGNSPYNGMTDAYLGLGMDEFGNFLNGGDNTQTGALNASLAASGTGVQTTSYSGPEYQPGRIGLRGYGNINLISLQAVNASATASNVQTVCNNGGTYTYKVNKKSVTTTFPDYAAIPNGYVNLPSTTPLANESAKNRTAATPISYKLQITQNGLLSLWYSWNGGNYVPVLTNQSIQSSNGTMPGSFLFGFGGSTGGSDNVHEITCFQATPANQASSSAGINVQQTSQVDTGTQVYVGFYHTNNWWGQLQSYEVLANTDGSISFSTYANWDASCVLTNPTNGGSCTSTNTTVNGEAWQSRALVTWSGTAGIPFTWGSLTSTEQGWLNDDSQGNNRVNYLAGDRSNEINSQGQGLFRNRTSVLGDIIDSSPTWVGPPSASYPATWRDLTNSSDKLPENQTNAQTYSAFETLYASRTNVVYEGANDGFMHGFQSGSYSGGNYISTDNNGQELIGYMPQAVLATIHNTANNSTADFSSTHYAHNYFVDSTPGTGDLFYAGKWHTWLVSGLGAGGNAIFAMDITDPTTLGVGSIIGEWSNSSNSPLTCATDTSGNQCMTHLGQTYGTPQIVRLHNGEWGVIFGNGFNSTAGDAGIYVMTISSAGSIDSVYYLSTGVGSPAGSSNLLGPNGIAYVTPVDLDGDFITDYVYAGDMYGNVWRFDLTSSAAANWAVTKYPNTTNGALFSTPQTTYTTKVGGNTINMTTTQPITTQVLALAVLPTPANSTPYLMIEFGTGAVTPATSTTAISYTGGQQALYGIWDWNQGTATTPGANYSGLVAGSTAPGNNKPITVSTLEPQTVLQTVSSTGSGTALGVRTVSANTICFVGTTCMGSSGTQVAGTQYGWYMNLPGFAGVTGVGVNSSTGNANQTEQVIYNPVEVDGAFIVDTTIPANNSPLTCSALNATGWTMALSPAEGGAFPESFFENPLTGTFSPYQGASISGIALGLTGSASILTVAVPASSSGGGSSGGDGGPSSGGAYQQANVVGMNSNGQATGASANPQQTATGQRMTWIQLN